MPELTDTYFDCSANNDQGIITITMSQEGDIGFVCVFGDAITITLSQHGDYGEDILVDADSITITITVRDSDVYTEHPKKNIVAWGRINYANFEIGRDNIAGEGGMDWKGWGYALFQLGSGPVCYGENGVSIMPPYGNSFGLQTIHRIGLAGQQAVCGTKKAQWFIDAEGEMFRLDGEGLHYLGYSEWLSQMTHPVMSHDEENEIIYICDGEYGFVYSIRDNSLGEGPNNITGIWSQGGTQYVVSSGTITTPSPKFCTDILDMGTRKPKTIHWISLATNVSETLYASIDHRRGKDTSFSTTREYVVDSYGRANIPVYGVEFRVRARTVNYESFDVDELLIDHTVHA